MIEFIHLNKEQTDVLKWTDIDDPNDTIIVNNEGQIIGRRYMMRMSPQDDGSYISEDFWYELNELGEWEFKKSS